MNNTITLSQEELAENLYAITGQLSKSRKEPDSAAATEDEMAVVTSCMDEALSSLGSEISRCGSVTETADSISVNLSMPPNWKEDVLPSLEKAVMSFLSNRIAEVWYSMTSTDNVEYHSRKSSSYAAEINALLCARTKPKRT